MTDLSWGEVLEAMCRYEKAWGVYLSYSAPVGYRHKSRVEVAKACPGLGTEQVETLVTAGSLYLFSETEAEARALYASTAAEDGPTATNSDAGEHTVYACLCSPTDGILSENT